MLSPLLAVSSLLSLLILLTPWAPAQSKEINIVTDIAPIHSLVSMVVGEQNEVTLLIPPSRSPHSFDLKPSQRRALGQAELIIILSADFTLSLSRHLDNLTNDKTVLTLSDSDDDESHTHGHETDPHTWLNPQNAIDWLDRIADAAASLDPSQTEFFKQNAQTAKTSISSLHARLKTSLAPISDEQYLVYHDAYQHFALSHNLQKPIAIALSDARSPGAAKLRAMRKQAENVKCVFSELQHEDTIVDMVTEQLSVNRGILDPMGSAHPTGKTLYPLLLQSLAQNFLDCMSN